MNVQASSMETLGDVTIIANGNPAWDKLSRVEQMQWLQSMRQAVDLIGHPLGFKKTFAVYADSDTAHIGISGGDLELFVGILHLKTHRMEHITPSFMPPGVK